MKHISEIYLSDRLDNFKISMIIMKFYLHYTLSQSLLDTQVNVHQVLEQCQNFTVLVTLSISKYVKGDHA